MREEISTSINDRIAVRVRTLRSDLGLSLEALAQKCDVSRSMLSLIERGESSATAVVLEKIATGLGVPLASLFEDATAPVNPLSRSRDRVPWRDPQSGYVRSNISPPNYPSPIQIVEVMLPAGAHVAYETGARDVNIQQQVWVQEGRLELTLGEQMQPLEAGDCFAMQVNQPTAFRNRTRKPARYIVVLCTQRGPSSRN